MPVRPVGRNAWLIVIVAERPRTRARHGRARWSLGAGSRRAVATVRRPLRGACASVAC
ncbi:MAG: hypothetical protein RL456_1345 [Pseudomonadota bacterium]|jgi:hypothetical protein